VHEIIIQPMSQLNQYELNETQDQQLPQINQYESNETQDQQIPQFNQDQVNEIQNQQILQEPDIRNRIVHNFQQWTVPEKVKMVQDLQIEREQARVLVSGMVPVDWMIQAIKNIVEAPETRNSIKNFLKKWIPRAFDAAYITPVLSSLFSRLIPDVDEATKKPVIQRMLDEYLLWGKQLARPILSARAFRSFCNSPENQFFKTTMRFSLLFIADVEYRHWVASGKKMGVTARKGQLERQDNIMNLIVDP